MSDTDTKVKFLDLEREAREIEGTLQTMRIKVSDEGDVNEYERLCEELRVVRTAMASLAVGLIHR